MGGVAVTRETGDGFTSGDGSDSGPAQKNYVDALIGVTPPTANNAVGTSHTFTITVTAFPSGTGTPTFGTPTISWGTGSADTGGPVPGTVGAITPVVTTGNVRTWTVAINSSSANTFYLYATD